MTALIHLLREKTRVFVCLCSLVMAMLPGCGELEPEIEAAIESPLLYKVLDCQLTVAGPVQRGKPVQAMMTLHNKSDVGLQVKRYFTPFEGIMGEIFTIRFKHEPLPYQGPQVKRAAPGDEDWFLLGPGQDLSASVNLAEAWDLTRPGEYQVNLPFGVSFRVPGEERQGLVITHGVVCPGTSFHILAQPEAIDL